MLMLLVNAGAVLFSCLAIFVHASDTHGSSSHVAKVKPARKQTYTPRQLEMRRVGQQARRAKAAQKLKDAVHVDEYGTTTDHEMIRQAKEKNEKQKQRQREAWDKRVGVPEQAQEIALNHLIRNIARDHRKTPKSEEELKRLKADAVEKSLTKGISSKEHLESVAEKTFVNYIPRDQRSVASRSASGSMST